MPRRSEKRGEALALATRSLRPPEPKPGQSDEYDPLPAPRGLRSPPRGSSPRAKRFVGGGADGPVVLARSARSKTPRAPSNDAIHRPQSPHGVHTPKRGSPRTKRAAWGNAGAPRASEWLGAGTALGVVGEEDERELAELIQRTLHCDEAALVASGAKRAELDWHRVLESEWQNGRRMARASQRVAQLEEPPKKGLGHKMTAHFVPSILFERPPEDGVALFLNSSQACGEESRGASPLFPSHAPHGQSSPALVALW
jgi:hypothetical protein